MYDKAGLVLRIETVINNREEFRVRKQVLRDYGRKAMGTTMYLREHHFPNVYAGVMH